MLARLGVFYLGKTHDLQRRVVNEKLVLYDSEDLTTHAPCVGKTRLRLALLEEAAIDAAPAVNRI